MRPGDRVGGIEVIRRAGAGGCGVVYEGKGKSGQSVAIKVLIGDSARSIARFEREAELLAKLVHPNIVRYIDHGRTPAGDHYLIEEWASGRSLATELTEVGMTLRSAVEMALEVSCALEAAHALGIVHRDIKPSNLVRHGDRWLVLDFGVAQVEEDNQRLTRTGALIGTIGYMSPEQARGEREITAAADLFSLGCVLYEALTGQPAFAGLNRLSIRAKVLMEQPPPISSFLPEAPPALIKLVASMLSKSALGRPADAAEVRDRLRALGELASTAPRPINLVEAPTAEMPLRPGARPALISMVLTAGFAHLAGDEIESWRERLRRAVAAFPGRPWVLEDGALIFASEPTMSGPAVAARAALAARQAFPGLAAFVVSALPGDPVGKSIERAATALERETLHGIFADFTAADETHETNGGIGIDETTAANLPPGEFDVERVADKLILRGLAQASAREGNAGGE